MFLGMEWYVWIIILLLVVVVIPLKLKIIKSFTSKRKNREDYRHD